jgi:hypothetical protein
MSKELEPICGSIILGMLRYQIVFLLPYTGVQAGGYAGNVTGNAGIDQYKRHTDAIGQSGNRGID